MTQTLTENVTTALSNMVARRDLSILFNKTILTIDNWREAGMPYVEIPGVRPTIRFVLDDVVAWADVHNKPYSNKALRALRARLEKVK